MNLYRGCTHNCSYCDGRSEKYYVGGEFGVDVEVKTNALKVLSRELDPKRKRTPLKPSFIMVGGGVCDSYQPIEKKYKLAQKALQLIHKYDFPAHVLTKSTLVKRDIDILKEINEQSRAIVSISFSSVDDGLGALLEPGVPPPSERLKTLEFFKSKGIACGMFLLPIVPLITDAPDLMEDSVRRAREVGVDFIIFGGMTLKEGRQKNYFFDSLNKDRPELMTEYQKIYRGSKWGESTSQYSDAINKVFNKLAKKYHVSKRIPSYLFKDILDENDLISVILDQIDYLLKIEDKTSPYGYASYSISQLKEPISNIKGNLQQLKGVGEVTERIILEILETGSSSYYKSLMRG
ncbi:MAG: radical SAM protein [Proteobacteria bacterium]|nr:radical SAM protein [Pseudomonadota bacterium]